MDYSNLVNHTSIKKMGTDVHKRKNSKNNFRLKEHIATFAKSDHYLSSKHNSKVIYRGSKTQP